jgi:hypothetical protein
MEELSEFIRKDELSVYPSEELGDEDMPSEDSDSDSWQ